MGEIELLPCPACGNQVSNRAESCPKCGHPLKLSGELDPRAQWEVCEIHFSGGNKRPYQFFAAARSPAGEYIEAVSEVWWPGPSERRELVRRSNIIDLNPQADDDNAGIAFDGLVNQLLKSNWEAVPDRGEHWWEVRFRRKWQWINDIGDSAVCTRDEYIILGESPNQGEWHLVPAGKKATLVEMNQEQGWAKIRTEDGLEGFFTEATDQKSGELSRQKVQLDPRVTASTTAGCLLMPLLAVVLLLLLALWVPQTLALVSF